WRMESLALGVAHHAPLRRGTLAVGTPRPRPQLMEDPEGVGCTAPIGAETIRAIPLAVHPHPPGGTMACNGFLLIARDRVLAHSSKEIVRLIVFAHMLK